MGYAFSQLTFIHPAWKNSVYGDLNEWVDGYRRQLLEALVDARVDSMAKLKHGLVTAKKQGGDFLPNPGTFAKWCRPHAAPYHKEFDDSNALEQLPSDAETRKREIAKLKELVNK